MGLFGFGYSKENFDKAKVELDQLAMDSEKAHREGTDAEKEVAFQKEFAAETKVDNLRKQAHKEALRMNKEFDKEKEREFEADLPIEEVDKEI